MKAYVLFTSIGPLVVLTSYESIDDPELIDKWVSKGLTKFIAHEVPIKSIKEKYGKRFDNVIQDLRETDDLRILDYSGERVFKNWSFKELGTPIYYEPYPGSMSEKNCSS